MVKMTEEPSDFEGKWPDPRERSAPARVMDITEQLTHESRIALAAAAEITRLRAEVDLVIAQREAWRDSALACQWSSAEFAADAGRLRAALENVRLLASRHRTEEWAGHMLRFCAEAGVKPSPFRGALQGDKP